MLDIRSLLCFSLLAMGCLGCDFGSSTAIKLPAHPEKPGEITTHKDGQPSATESVMMAHPEYANWSQFPVGASVTRRRLVTNEFGEVKVTTRLWLEEKSDQEVTVGSQVTVERPDQPIEVNPDNFTKYVAQFEIPPEMKAEAFLLPSNKAKCTGEEMQEVGGREFKTEVYEWQESNESGPMTVKLWRCNEIPGRIVRQEMLTLSSSTRTLETIDALEMPDKTSDAGLTSPEEPTP